MKTIIKKSKTLFGSLALAIIMVVSSCTKIEENTLAPNSNPSASRIQADDYSKIVDALANVAVGSRSGLSKTGMGGTDCDDEYVLDPKTKKWVALNDGAIFRNIIKEYDIWYKANKKNNPQCTHPSATQAVKDKMLAQFGLSSYTVNDKNSFVGKVMDVYKAKYCDKGKVILPTDDNSTLEFLDCQQQCKEWLNRVVKNASGKDAPTYSNKATYIIKKQKDAKAGMLIYKKTGLVHSGIITKLVLNTDGTILYLTVKESNWGTGLEANPYGQLPWKRTIGERTTGYKDKGVQKGDAKFLLTDYDIVALTMQ